MNTPIADGAEVRHGISLLFQLGDVVEVRIVKTRVGTVSGYFDDPEKLAAAIQDGDTRYRAGGVYYVLNRVDHALLGRAYNRLRERTEYTTADNNILRRRWLPIDLDPVRPRRHLLIRGGARSRHSAGRDHRFGDGK